MNQVSARSKFGGRGGETYAGKANNDEALVLVLLVKLLKAAVLAGEAAVAGRVDDEDRL